MRKIDFNLQQNIKKKTTSFILKALIYFVLFGFSFVFLYPFIYAFVTSFKSYNDINNMLIKWIPQEFTPSNWKLAFDALDAERTFFNSVLVTALSTAGHLLSCSLAAYGFARFKFKGKAILFGIVLLTIIVPIQTIIAPVYMIFGKLGWVGTYFPLIVPTFFGMGLKGGLFIFLFRQFFLKIPPSLEEAAWLDGCNEYTTFFKIVMPTTKSASLVCFVLSVVWHWNDYFEPGIYITSEKSYLMPQKLPSLYELFQSITQAGSAEAVKLALQYHEGVVMAATMLSVLFLLIVYFILQRQFMQGIERTGMVE